MKLRIVSPEKQLYQGDAKAVIVPGTKGRFEVLDNHAPVISSLQEGSLVVMNDSETKYQIKSGFIEVANNEVSICVEI
ncbi:MAG: ATP synthase F1 subunit epsilon [Prevotellaceae bacterium]|nr:ATP synthase F1 subunit epsilon [Candidatus Faecinaster equi]